VYAGASIPTYWIVNLNDRFVEVYTTPSGPSAKPAYENRTDYPFDQALPVAIDGKTIGSVTLAEILAG
jgi:Uma2 family endonuclease